MEEQAKGGKSPQRGPPFMTIMATKVCVGLSGLLGSIPPPNLGSLEAGNYAVPKVRF